MTRFKFQILLGIMAYALSLGCSTTGQPENTIQAVASAIDCIVILPRETNGKHIPEPVIAEEVKECLRIRDLLVAQGYLVKQIALGTDSITIKFSQADMKNTNVVAQSADTNKNESLGYAKLESEFHKLVDRTYTTPAAVSKNQDLEVPSKNKPGKLAEKEAKTDVVKAPKPSHSKKEEKQSSVEKPKP